MEELIKLLKENQVGVLTTATDQIPHGRPQHIHYIFENKFYFTTANTKEAYRQLKENPNIEFIVIIGYQVIRLSGKVAFADDLQTKQMLLENAPLVKQGYQTANNPILEVFYLEHGKISYFDMLDASKKKEFTF